MVVEICVCACVCVCVCVCILRPICLYHSSNTHRLLVCMTPPLRGSSDETFCHVKIKPHDAGHGDRDIEEGGLTLKALQLAGCFMGLQVSYITWGFIQSNDTELR